MGKEIVILSLKTAEKGKRSKTNRKANKDTKKENEVYTYLRRGVHRRRYWFTITSHSDPALK